VVGRCTLNITRGKKGPWRFAFILCVTLLGRLQTKKASKVGIFSQQGAGGNGIPSFLKWMKTGGKLVKISSKYQAFFY